MTVLMAVVFGVIYFFRSTMGFWIIGTVIGIVNVISIFIADGLFRWQFFFRANNAEDIEPGDVELSSRKVKWSFITLGVFFLYIFGL